MKCKNVSAHKTFLYKIYKYKGINSYQSHSLYYYLLFYNRVFARRKKKKSSLGNSKHS